MFVLGLGKKGSSPESPALSFSSPSLLHHHHHRLSFRQQHHHNHRQHYYRHHHRRHHHHHHHPPREAITTIIIISIDTPSHDQHPNHDHHHYRHKIVIISVATTVVVTIGSVIMIMNFISLIIPLFLQVPIKVMSRRFLSTKSGSSSGSFLGNLRFVFWIRFHIMFGTCFRHLFPCFFRT